MPRPITVGGQPLLIGTAPLVAQQLSEVTDWLHSWDMKDATTYIPSAQEQSDFGVTAAPRVASVIDRGNGTRMDMKRDQGWWRDTFSQPGLFPGPLYIASSARFNGRPAMRTDQLVEGGESFDLHSVLSPNATLGNGNSTSDPGFFNPPLGYDPPYWGVVITRKPITGDLWAAQDAVNGGSGTAPTVGGGQLLPAPTTVGFSTFGTPQLYLDTGHAISSDETYAIRYFVKAGANNSLCLCNFRTSGGVLTTVGDPGTMNAWTYKECFVGGVEHTYWTFSAFKLGEVTAGELLALRDVVAPLIPPAGTIGVEP